MNKEYLKFNFFTLVYIKEFYNWHIRAQDKIEGGKSSALYNISLIFLHELKIISL